MRWYALVGFALGAGLTAWVIRRSGAGLELQQLRAGWPLVLLAMLWFAVPLAAAAQSWRWLFPAASRPAPGPALRLTWIGLGINWLLPVAMIGGEVVKFRLGRLAGWPARVLAASLVADKTLQAFSQVIVLPLGLGLLLGLTDEFEWRLGGVVWLIGFTVAVVLFYRLQQTGMFSGMTRLLGRLTRELPRELPRAELRSRRLDAALRRIYRRRGALLAALAWRLGFRLLLAGEILLVLALALGDVSLGSPGQILLFALVLESLAQGARAMAFFIPAGLGAQEGALIGVGMLLGLPPDSLLLIALVKRARELLVGGAALLQWQWQEARRLRNPM